MNRYVPYIIIILCSVVYFFVTENFELGISPDSVNYIEIAKNINNGNSFTISNKLITHWPPGYPILLSFTSKISGLTILETAKLLNLFLFVLYGLTFKYILDEFNFFPIVKNTLLLILLISLPTTVALFAWSELPFLVLMNALFLSFINSLKKPSLWLLILAGILSFCALMIRYAATGFIVGLVVWQLFLCFKEKGQNIKRLLIYISPILLGLVLWRYWTYTYGTNYSHRELSLHLVSFNKIQSSIKEIVTWFCENLVASFFFICFIISNVIILFKGKNKIFSVLKKRRRNILLICSLLFSYYSIIIISISLFDAYTPLDNRILSPLFPFFLILIGLLLNDFLQQKNKLTSFFICIFLCLSCFISSKETWTNHFKNGSIYTGKTFDNYRNIIQQYVADFDGKTYTNGSEFIQFVTGNKKIKSLPEKISPYSLKKSKDFLLDFEKMNKEVQNKKAQIIYFKIINRCWFQICLNEINTKKATQIEDILIIK